jgi:hypothetical protein
MKDDAGAWAKYEPAFSTITFHFQLDVCKQFVKALGRCMYLLGLDTPDRLYESVKVKSLAWEVLNNAAQLIKEPEDLFSLRKEYQKLIAQK